MATLLVPSQYATMNAAWADAADGDTIEIEDGGTYPVIGLLSTGTRSLTIVSYSATRPTIETGSGTAAFSVGSGQSVTLIGLNVNGTGAVYGFFGTTGQVVLERAHVYGVGTIFRQTASAHQCLLVGALTTSSNPTVLTSCVLTDCNGAVGAGTSLVNCTLVECDAGSGALVPSGATASNCLLLDCETTGDYLVEGTATNCHHYGCTAAVSAFSGGTSITTGDPLLRGAWGGVVRALTPGPTSPLLGAGVGGAVATDYFGTANTSPPVIGAVTPRTPATLLVPSVYETVDAAWAASDDGDSILIEGAGAYSLAAALVVPAWEVRIVKGDGAGASIAAPLDDAFVLRDGCAISLEALSLEASTIFGDESGSVSGASVSLVDIVAAASYRLVDHADSCSFTAARCDLDSEVIAISAADVTLESCVVRGRISGGVVDVRQVLFQTGLIEGGAVISSTTTGVAVNCSFTSCSTPGDYIAVLDTFTSCHRHDCTSAVSTFDGAETDTVTGAPLLSDGPHDIKPTVASPLVGAGAASGVALDYYGNAFGAVPTIGPAEVAVLLSASADDAGTVRAVFSAPVSLESLAVGLISVEPVGLGAIVVPYAAELDGDTELVVTVWPRMGPAIAYAFTASPELPTDDVGEQQSAAFVSADYDLGEPPPLQGHWEAWTTMVGRELQALGGRAVAVIREDFAPSDTLLKLSSTYAFPAVPEPPAPPPAVWIDGQRFSYGALGDGALGDVTGPPRIKTIPRGSIIAVDESSVPVGDTTPDVLSRIEAGWRSTLTHRAEGDQADGVWRLHGLPRPAGFPESSWRLAVGAVAYGPKGLPRGTYDFLAGALSHYARAVEVELRPGQPARIYATAGAPFTQSDVGRWVRLNGENYLVIGPADVASTSAGEWLELCAVETGYWRRAHWSGPETTTATAEILAFWLRSTTPGPIRAAVPRGTYHGRAAHLEVYIWADAVGDVPPTYLLEAGVDTPEGMPYGGHILEGASVDGDQEDGPFPIYLYDYEVHRDLWYVLDLLMAAGVTVSLLRRQTWGYVPA